MANEARLIDANEILEKGVSIPGCVSKMVSTWDIVHAPTVDAVEVVHGRWIVKEHSAPYGGFHLFHCSECDSPNAQERNYCPNCGAKMDGDGNG